MSLAVADLLTSGLAGEIAESRISVFAVTSPATVVAALAARELGKPQLAIATGMTAIDASPIPSVTLGEAGLYPVGRPRADDPFDTFVLLARGCVGVAAAPAQLDRRGRTNLSGIGALGQPKVALPGARGLPDNNASRSPIWFMLADHSGRQLVESVDVVCGAAPLPSIARRLLTPAGCFELREHGWCARWITSRAPELIPQAPAFGIELSGTEPVIDDPDPLALRAVRRADPHDVRFVEFATGEEAAALYRKAAESESPDRVLTS